jgi:hypothetical protein
VRSAARFWGARGSGSHISRMEQSRESQAAMGKAGGANCGNGPTQVCGRAREVNVPQMGLSQARHHHARMIAFSFDSGGEMQLAAGAITRT